jgi:endonuclease III
MARRTVDFAGVAAALSRAYGDFAHHNKSDPFDELLFIVCSTKTNESGYRGTYGKLMARFPTRASLAVATAKQIERAILSGGLAKQKSGAIRKIADTIIGKFGKPTLSPLKKCADREAEEFLRSLPSVGPKVARCVMMYSLGRQVFPVDTHCWRIVRRLGWARPTQKDGHCAPRDMDRIQEKIPPEFRFSLHVNFVSHGRAVCTASSPKCGDCVIAVHCRRVGVK